MNTHEMYTHLAEGGYARPFFFKNRGNIFQEFMPKHTIETIVEAALNIPKENMYSFIELTSMGGKIGEVSPNETAFPHRGAKIWALYSSLWSNEVDNKINIEWIDNFMEKMEKYYPPTSPKYVNFLNFSLTRKQALKAYFGENLHRLRKIKEKYDPKNIFNFEQSIDIK